MRDENRLVVGGCFHVLLQKFRSPTEDGRSRTQWADLGWSRKTWVSVGETRPSPVPAQGRRPGGWCPVPNLVSAAVWGGGRVGAGRASSGRHPYLLPRGTGQAGAPRRASSCSGHGRTQGVGGRPCQVRAETRGFFAHPLVVAGPERRDQVPEPHAPGLGLRAPGPGPRAPGPEP